MVFVYNNMRYKSYRFPYFLPLEIRLYIVINGSVCIHDYIQVQFIFTFHSDLFYEKTILFSDCFTTGISSLYKFICINFMKYVCTGKNMYYIDILTHVTIK